MLGVGKVGVAIAVAVLSGTGSHGDRQRPPLAITMPAGEVGPKAAVLRGIVKPRGPSTTYWFVYGTSEKYGAKTPEGVAGGRRPSRVSALVEGLAPDTTYHFRLLARNGKGVAKGQDRVFVTLPVDDGGGSENGEGEEEEAKGWSLQTTPNPGGFGNNLETVSCLSAAGCIAAGESSGPMAELWDGSSWSLIPTPAAPVEVDSVSCTSLVACTAVGHSETSTFAMRWDGAEWNIQSTVDQPGASRSLLHGVSCVSPTFCMAVGNYETGAGWYPLAEVWDGAEWSLQAIPNLAGISVNYLYDVSCTSSTACTAGGYTPGGAFSAHWNGVSWTAQKAPPGSSSFDGVSCTSATSCIAVGHTPSIAGVHAARWNGAEWQTMVAVNPPGSVRAELTSVACVSTSACVAVGWFESEAGTGTAYTLAEIWNGAEWRIEPTVNPPGSVSSGLQDVSCVVPLVCEAVGRYNAGPILGFAERYE